MSAARAPLVRDAEDVGWVEQKKVVPASGTRVPLPVGRNVVGRLRRYLLLVGVVCLAAVGQALGFDESRIDFTDPGLKVVYVLLERDASGLRVVLTPDRVAGSVSTITVRNLIPDLDGKALARLYGSRPWAGGAFAGVLRLEHASTSYSRITLSYRRSAAAVAGLYLRRLRALGYTVDAEVVTGNITVYQARQGDEALRLVVVRQGAHSRVTIAAAAPR